MKYAIEMTACGMIYIPSFIKTGTGIPSNIKVLPQQFERL
jgi:hypothetical protein